MERSLRQVKNKLEKSFAIYRKTIPTFAVILKSGASRKVRIYGFGFKFFKHTNANIRRIRPKA
ncbi:hypothetical protein GCM10011506_13940 [Marivirga lumbricoides]|uniref:Uncharacterized protein n=1 Tax=Marivirga lumbricoides TaxID=1046115 RepID=A0ABQ1LU92_9BACT|nr:hypothetical protein GCM10011506_13940 [Marivirga lumbricoides]